MIGLPRVGSLPHLLMRSCSFSRNSSLFWSDVCRAAPQRRSHTLYVLVNYMLQAKGGSRHPHTWLMLRFESLQCSAITSCGACVHTACVTQAHPVLHRPSI